MIDSRALPALALTGLVAATVGGVVLVSPTSVGAFVAHPIAPTASDATTILHRAIMSRLDGKP